MMAAVTVAYALSSIDLIPDFIPVSGCFDDIILLPLLIVLTTNLIPDEVFLKNESNEGMWQDKKPKKWYYAKNKFEC